MPLAADLGFTVALARSAGVIVRECHGRVERLTKHGAEAVTEADRASQRHIVAALAQRFPDDGVIGEEDDAGEAITSRPPRAGERCWVIDPIDGTNNFVAGLGNFAVCIGLLDGGMPVLGVVYDVSRDQMWSAARGHGAWCDARPIAAATTPLGDASLLMLTSNLLDAERRLPAYVPRWLRDTTWKLRMLGSAALEAVQVAGGVAHGAITVNGKLWDIAAPAAIILEAGGVLTDLVGEPVFPYPVVGYRGAKVPFLAAGPAAHPLLLAEIRAGEPSAR